MKLRVLPLLVLSGLLASCAGMKPGGASGPEVKLARLDDRVRVEIDGNLFTEYVFKGAQKPYLYPVLAVDGTEMTRNFPMKEVAGEVKDHPHHRSLWFTHGDVNGFDFWAETNGPKQGRVVNESVETSTQDGVGIIRSRNQWVGPNGVVQMTDDTTIRVHGTPDARFIDYEVTLKAPADRPVVLGDTKEGSMAIRLPLWMTPPHRYRDQATKKQVDHQGKGTIINDAGVKNTPTWGKKSTWVDYYAPKDGKVYGVAMFDHPLNPRHPTWWHVRDYALFAANPFGQHDFEPEHKNNPKAGNLTIPAGGNTTFRWRFYFHNGDEVAAKVAEQYQAYATRK